MIELATVRRPAEDILGRVVRLTLGGTEYILPVRSIRANREWKERLDGTTVGLLATLEASEDDLAAIYAALGSQVDELIELLLSYDTAGVLPSKAEIEELEPDATMDVVTACREVWRAASPLVAMSLEALAPLTIGLSSTPTSGPPPAMAGDQASSTTSSPTSSSSRTSMPRPTALPATPNGSSAPASKPRASGRSTPTTTGPTSDGESPRPNRAARRSRRTTP